MKFRNRKEKVKKKKGNRPGPVPSVSKNGSYTYPLRLPIPFRERYVSFVKKSKEHNVKVLPLSVIFRVGGKRYLAEKEKELNAAIKGRLHAKIRK